MKKEGSLGKKGLQVWISCNWVDLVVGIGLKSAFVGIVGPIPTTEDNPISISPGMKGRLQGSPMFEEGYPCEIPEQP